MIKYPLYVTLDTNIFISKKFDFSEGSQLGLLVNYVKAEKIKVVLSNIVTKEVEKHIVEEGNNICGQLRKLRSEVLKTASEKYLEQIGLESYLVILNKEEYQEKSLNVWKSFVNSLDPEILDTSKIDLSTIINDYFNGAPPFEKSDKKKNEFPDAFIANQINTRFNQNEIVAIVSKDNGFKRACEGSEYYKFYDSLGDLYDEINRNDKEYNEIVKNINSLIQNYTDRIHDLAMKDDCINVYGRTIDIEGNIGGGFNYNDFKVVSINDIRCSVRSIDEITEKTVFGTLLCKAIIEVDCFYDDDADALWDKENEVYYNIETRTNYEKHNAEISIGIILNRENNDLNIMPFKVFLNSYTLCERYDKEEYMQKQMEIEKELINENRQTFGFCSLDHYSDLLEDDLLNSEFMESVTNIFKEINTTNQEYEEIATIYDDLISTISSRKSDNLIKKLAIQMKKVDTFPKLSNLDNLTENDISQVISWAEQSLKRTNDLFELDNLPDYFTYGDIIEINDDGKIYEFIIGGIPKGLSEGDQEIIDVSIRNKNGIVASGYVELTVGYMSFDEDGGASEGTNDNIDYHCENVIEALEQIASSMEKVLINERNIADEIKNLIK